MIVVLDRQHSGKPHNIEDLGCWGDLDHDGKASIRESESVFTGLYLWHAEIRLREHGHTVYPISHGRYRERHKSSNEVGADVYVAAHLNSLTGGSRTRSGQGADYAAVFYDYRSRPGRGAELAACIGEQLSAIPVLGSRVRIWPAKPTDWTSRAYSTISGTRAAAICYEPAFLDYRPHQEAFMNPEGIALLGIALVDGIHKYSQRGTL